MIRGLEGWSSLVLFPDLSFSGKEREESEGRTEGFLGGMGKKDLYG